MKKILLVLIILITLLVYNLQNNMLQNNDENRTSISDKSVNIDNYEYIKIGDSKDTLFSLIGKPSRIDESGYNFKWYIYNNFKQKFIMVGVDNDEVVATYSNSINSKMIEDININESDIKDVRRLYDPIEYKQKGNNRYMINSNNQYDVIKKDNNYITIFYDIYDSNKVCSYQIVNAQAEENLTSMYPHPSEELIKSFELQIIDLVNSVRQKENLNILEYSEKATISSKRHSEDMKNNNYFDHINKQDETPFDRMKKEKIIYQTAGENIAAGQISAIYAHEAWMNSKGHRNNILGDYNNIGVGISFGGYYKIYYTQNFYK